MLRPAQRIGWRQHSAAVCADNLASRWAIREPRRPRSAQVLKTRYASQSTNTVPMPETYIEHREMGDFALIRRLPGPLMALLLLPVHAAASPLPGCESESLAEQPVNVNVDFESQVQPILSAACAGCHGGAGNLSLEPGLAYAQLVSVAASNPAAQRPRVHPGDAADSFLWRKINCTGLDDLPGQPYGRRMPRNGPPYLGLADQALILDWIEQGALPAADPDRIWGNDFERRPPPAFDGEFGARSVVDEGEHAHGIRRIVSADLSGNGLPDLIATQPFNINHVAVWMNLGDGLFADKLVIDNSLHNPVYSATGDFNGNGRLDLAVITQTTGELFWYANLEDGFAPGIRIDQDRFFGNALVTGDFDGSGHVDIVAIGQHSIDLFRNDGTGTFAKEEILTPQTSPNVLECLHIETADMNGNGHLDLVVAETFGGVIYFNDGKGDFTPHRFTEENSFIVLTLHVFDANGNGLPDVVVQTSNRAVSLYLNDGNGAWLNAGNPFPVTQPIRSFQSVDVDGDGRLDLYVAHEHKARVYRNLGNGDFSEMHMVDEHPELHIDEIAVADLLGDGRPELIWSAVNRKLAYRRLR